MDDQPGEVSTREQTKNSEISSSGSVSDVAQPQNAHIDRAELLQKARGFLLSPQVRYEDLSIKRRFLAEKGLNDVEIEALLQELLPQLPLVPPRTYPQPPPSNLPNLFIGVARIASWIAGGSVTLLLIYFRFIYPRIAHTYQARHSLRTYHKELLGRLTATLESVKATQAATFAILPQPDPHKDSQYGHCQTLDEVAAACQDRRDVPDVTLLRCAMSDLTAEGKKTTTEDIFLTLEAKIPWLKGEEGAQDQEKLWQTLSTHPLFRQEDAEGTATWSFEAPTPPPEPPLLVSLHSLKRALPGPAPATSRFQRTLEALTDLTGYIATQTYSTFRMPSMGFAASPLNPEEEEVKKEIRALKGLVLNRRSFMPNVPRLPSSTGVGFRSDAAITP